MNERYLFRGKRLDNGEWATGGIYFHIDNRLGIMAGDIDSCGSGVAAVIDEVDPATVGQCTGIHAAKSYRGDNPEDKLVFEGDIVRERTAITKVEWSEIYKRWFLVGINTHRVLEPGVNFDDIDLEIIGNIHDNPELLNEGSGKP